MERPDADIPIIAMTANAFADDVKRNKEAGMNDRISKSLDAQKIISVLILITNKTIDKKSSHNPYTQDYAQFFV